MIVTIQRSIKGMIESYQNASYIDISLSANNLFVNKPLRMNARVEMYSSALKT